MPIPDVQTLMLPALKALSGGGETPLSEIRNRVASAEKLAAKDLRELLPSGQQTVFSNRIFWAVTYLTRAGLMEKVRRGVYRLARQGTRLLHQAPTRLDFKRLREYPAFSKWHSQRKTSQSPKGPSPPGGQGEQVCTPEEVLNNVIRQSREALESEVLERIRKAGSTFFEQVVRDLLIIMGYGGGDTTMGQVIGRTGDCGIDGTIRHDALGFDRVYIQVKKYAEGRTIGTSDLHHFIDAIDAAGTNKGVFFTTASFAPKARNYVKLCPKRIVLIDGPELARLMVAHGVGVRAKIRHEIKRIDEDYFKQEAF